NLTPRQRELLQQYADDVEGRRTSNATNANSTPIHGATGGTNRPSSSSSSDNHSDPATTKNPRSSSVTGSRPDPPDANANSTFSSSRGTEQAAGTDPNGSSSGNRTDGTEEANENGASRND
ncbi:hypothetical protein FRC17_005538, partial [Serendipita sp. 399]